jgi:hypothetical protein
MENVWLNYFLNIVRHFVGNKIGVKYQFALSCCAL